MDGLVPYSGGRRSRCASCHSRSTRKDFWITREGVGLQCCRVFVQHRRGGVVVRGVRPVRIQLVRFLAPIGALGGFALRCHFWMLHNFLCLLGMLGSDLARARRVSCGAATALGNLGVSFGAGASLAGSGWSKIQE